MSIGLPNGKSSSDQAYRFNDNAVKIGSPHRAITRSTQLLNYAVRLSVLLELRSKLTERVR